MTAKGQLSLHLVKGKEQISLGAGAAGAALRAAQSRTRFKAEEPKNGTL